MPNTTTINHSVKRVPAMKLVRRPDGASRLFPDTREGARQALLFLQGRPVTGPRPLTEHRSPVLRQVVNHDLAGKK